ncbi:hypothetical protein RBI15_04765 [Anaerostipes hadrus]|uniref:Uncharacterized protein n=1 Tax=Anaerostipes hadrus TaxID=649756 RepID=A0AAQ3PUT6_ANAHA|nr:hypothetical protein [Anaerostipes hadrus]WMD17409.1 hypothetical protein RBI15_04765 [Anaerostipes hadrus]WMD26215.1 hypothetical protein RBI16_04765 [Anaerostipes hadrus]
MAKFNIEVELDWMEEDSYSIDEELKERIIEGVEDVLLHKASNEAVRIVDKKIAEKVSEAEETINKAVNQFIENVCSEKINKIQIPEKKSNWSDEVTYYSMSEYVGKKFEEFLTERRYTREGKLGSYSSERQLSAADLLTTKYLELEFGTKIEEMIQNAKHEVEIDIVKSLEQKLKENLTKETIEKMNIPEVLKKLESGSLGLVEQKER